MSLDDSKFEYYMDRAEFSLAEAFRYIKVYPESCGRILNDLHTVKYYLITAWLMKNGIKPASDYAHLLGQVKELPKQYYARILDSHARLVFLDNFTIWSTGSKTPSLEEWCGKTLQIAEAIKELFFEMKKELGYKESTGSKHLWK
jgi:hypothetical protein